MRMSAAEAAPPPPPAPAPAPAAARGRGGARRKKAGRAPARKKPASKKSKGPGVVARAVVKRRRRPDEHTGPLGGGALSDLPWELLWDVCRYLDVGRASVWRACSRASARAVHHAFGEDRVELSHSGALVATCAPLRSVAADDEADAAEELWTHEHNWRCERCATGGDLLCCDYCNLVFHLGCLGLEEAPEGLWRCPECASDASAPVIGATAAAPRPDGRFVVVGGYHHGSFTPNGDAYVCAPSAATAAWRREVAAAPPPAAGVASSDCCVVGGVVLAFARFGDGGAAEPVPWHAVAAPPQRAAAGAAATFDALWTLDADDAWRREPLRGTIPSTRSDAAVAHATVGRRPHLLVYGGFAPDHRRNLDGLHALDLRTRTWATLTADDVAPMRRAVTEEEAPEQEDVEEPPERRPRTATEEIFGESDSSDDDDDDEPTQRGQLALVFGLRDRAASADRFVAGPATGAPKKKKKKKKRAKAVAAAATAPSARSGHTLTRLGARSLVLFGGLGRVPAANTPTLTRNDYLNDAWTLRLESLSRSHGGLRHAWARLPCGGAPPSGRAGHSAAAVGPHLVVFGGVTGHKFLADLHVLHVPSRCWSQPALDGPRPSPRMRPALLHLRQTDLDDEPGPTLLLFGGTRAWGSAAAVATATARHDGDLFAITLQPAKLVVSL